MKNRILLTMSFVLMTMIISAQADHGSWTTIRLKHKLNPKTEVSFRPIVRHNQDWGNYVNTSLDFTARYFVDKSWSTQLLYRHFFVPDNLPDRDFIFWDISHKYKINDRWALLNIFRYHFALDAKREDSDFVRYMPLISYQYNDKLKLLAQTDWFVRLDGFNELQRFRYQLGFDYKFNAKTSLNFQYWREEDTNVEFINKTNWWVSTLTIVI